MSTVPLPTPSPSLLTGPGAPFRLRLARAVESEPVQRFVVTLIVLNALCLGLETVPSVHASAGGLLGALDRAFLAVFVVELAAKLVGHGGRFFRSAWNVFDLLVVGVSLVPAAGAFSVLRALRVVRAFRLLTAIPKMRLVVAGLLGAIPGLSSVIMLMGVVYYVAAVMATNLFGRDFPEWFGGVGRSAYSLFQIMTLESWSMGIVRPVMEVHPYAWAFFVPYIVVATFTMLNLFIGIIVSAIQAHAAREADAAADAAVEAAPPAAPPALEEALDALRREVAALRQDVARLSEVRGDRP